MKYGQSVLVSDDNKSWKLASVIDINNDSFYKYKVEMHEHDEPVWFRYCLSVEEYEQRAQKELLIGFYRFLKTVPDGIKGKISNKELINKYLKIQKRSILMAFGNEYNS